MQPMKCKAAWALSLILAGGGGADVERQRIGTQINSYKQALLARDGSALVHVLSADVVAAARAQGGDLATVVAAGFEPQRAGMVAQFGEKYLRANSIRVEEVFPLGSGELGVSISVRSKALPRLVYFAIEDGEYKLTGASEPKAPLALLVTAGITAAHWPHWRFQNNDNDV
jgi:hypothetical protein